MRDNELKKLLPFYVDALRLGDWRIGFRIVSPKEMRVVTEGSDNTLGYCRWNSFERVAEIFVLKHKDHKKLVESSVCSNCPTQEETMVHELLHVVLHDYEADTTRLEQVVNMLAPQITKLRKG